MGWDRLLIRRGVSSQALADVTRQLAELLGGGVSLDQALALVSAHTEHRVMREVLQAAEESVRSGQQFSDALAEHPQAFSPVYLGMVRAGEMSGQLETVLVRLAEMLERESELAHRFTAALAYPVVVLMLGLVTVNVLLFAVLPKLRMLFEETGQELPLPTRLLLAASEGLGQWWGAWLLAILGAGWGFRVWWGSAAGRAARDRVVLRLPLIRTLVSKREIARLTRQVGLLLEQGVTVPQAFDLASHTLSNGSLHRAVKRASVDVQTGNGLAEALERTGEVPPFVCMVARVGEESGTLERALLHVASAYERQTDRLLETATRLLEPALIIMVGLMVMGIVMAMLLPIFELGGVMG